MNSRKFPVLFVLLCRQLTVPDLLCLSFSPSLFYLSHLFLSLPNFEPPAVASAGGIGRRAHERAATEGEIKREIRRRPTEKKGEKQEIHSSKESDNIYYQYH